VEAGYMQVVDHGGVTGDWCPYDLDRTVPVRIIHRLDAGTYDVWFGDLLVTDDEPHGIIEYGIGKVIAGFMSDPDLEGRFYIDNLWVATSLPPAEAACCLDTDCADANAMDCAFAGGEHHLEWPGCDPNPCLPSVVDEAGEIGTRAATRPILLPARPSPFRGTTTLGYLLPVATELRIEVHDAAGRRVRALFAGRAPRGAGSIAWDGRDDRGVRVAPGTYFARLAAGEETSTRRLLIVR